MAYEKIDGQTDPFLDLSSLEDIPDNSKIKCRVRVTGVDNQNNPIFLSLDSEPIERLIPEAPEPPEEPEPDPTPVITTLNLNPIPLNIGDTVTAFAQVTDFTDDWTVSWEWAEVTEMGDGNQRREFVPDHRPIYHADLGNNVNYNYDSWQIGTNDYLSESLDGDMNKDDDGFFITLKSNPDADGTDPKEDAVLWLIHRHLEPAYQAGYRRFVIHSAMGTAYAKQQKRYNNGRLEYGPPFSNPQGGGHPSGAWSVGDPNLGTWNTKRNIFDVEAQPIEYPFTSNGNLVSEDSSAVVGDIQQSYINFLKPWIDEKQAIDFERDPIEISIGTGYQLAFFDTEQTIPARGNLSTSDFRGVDWMSNTDDMQLIYPLPDVSKQSHIDYLDGEILPWKDIGITGFHIERAANVSAEDKPAGYLDYFKDRGLSVQADEAPFVEGTFDLDAFAQLNENLYKETSFSGPHWGSRPESKNENGDNDIRYNFWVDNWRDIYVDPADSEIHIVLNWNGSVTGSSNQQLTLGFNSQYITRTGSGNDLVITYDIDGMKAEIDEMISHGFVVSCATRPIESMHNGNFVERDARKEIIDYIASVQQGAGGTDTRLANRTPGIYEKDVYFAGTIDVNNELASRSNWNDYLPADGKYDLYFGTQIRQDGTVTTVDGVDIDWQNSDIADLVALNDDDFETHLRQLKDRWRDLLADSIRTRQADGTLDMDEIELFNSDAEIKRVDATFSFQFHLAALYQYGETREDTGSDGYWVSNNELENGLYFEWDPITKRSNATTRANIFVKVWLKELYDDLISEENSDLKLEGKFSHYNLPYRFPTNSLNVFRRSQLVNTTESEREEFILKVLETQSGVHDGGIDGLDRGTVELIYNQCGTFSDFYPATFATEKDSWMAYFKALDRFGIAGKNTTMGQGRFNDPGWYSFATTPCSTWINDPDIRDKPYYSNDDFYTISESDQNEALSFWQIPLSVWMYIQDYIYNNTSLNLCRFWAFGTDTKIFNYKASQTADVNAVKTLNSQLDSNFGVPYSMPPTEADKANYARYRSYGQWHPNKQSAYGTVIKREPPISGGEGGGGGGEFGQGI